MGDNYSKMFISPILIQLSPKAVGDTDMKLCTNLVFSGLTCSHVQFNVCTQCGLCVNNNKRAGDDAHPTSAVILCKNQIVPTF